MDMLLATLQLVATLLSVLVPYNQVVSPPPHLAF